MNDLQMTKRGDLAIIGYDILTTDSIEQAILIKLRWFFGEWVFNQSYGIEWFEKVLIKNPNKLLIRRMIEDAILSVDGVKSVSDLKLTVNNVTRKATISFKASTTQGAQDLMETIGLSLADDEITVTVNGHTMTISSPSKLYYVVGHTLVFTKYAKAGIIGNQLIIGRKVDPYEISASADGGGSES